MPVESEYVGNSKKVLTGQNEFASGGLLLMIIGGISVWLRAVLEVSGIGSSVKRP